MPSVPWCLPSSRSEGPEPSSLAFSPTMSRWQRQVLWKLGCLQWSYLSGGRGELCRRQACRPPRSADGFALALRLYWYLWGSRHCKRHLTRRQTSSARWSSGCLAVSRSASRWSPHLMKGPARHHRHRSTRRTLSRAYRERRFEFRHGNQRPCGTAGRRLSARCQCFTQKYRCRVSGAQIA
jgi:hypothetical protein